MAAKKPKSAPKIRYISPDMLWEAPQSPRNNGTKPQDSQGDVDKSNALKRPQSGPDRWRGADGTWQYSAQGYRKMMAEYQQRKAANQGDQGRRHIEVREELHRVNANTCPFCGVQLHLHPPEGCPEFNRLQAEFRARNTARGMRPGVPWEWAVEHYAKQGKVPPLPRHMYD
jgi:hypothetical protein